MVEYANTARPQRPATGGGARHAIVLIAASLMPVLAILSLVPVLPALTREFAATPGALYLVPVALTLPALCIALFSPAAGWLADRIGRKRLLVGALALYGVCGVAPLFLHSITALLVTRFGVGVFEATVMTLAFTLLGDYYEGEARRRWYAIQVLCSSLCAIVAVALGGLMGQLLGPRGPFCLYFIALPVALACALILFEPLRRHVAKAAGFPMTRSFASLLGLTVLAGLLFYAVQLGLGQILEGVGVSAPSKIGLIGATDGVAIALGSLLFKRYAKIGTPRMLMAGFGSAAIGYAMIGLSHTPAVVVAASIVTCFGGGILLPTLLTAAMSTLSDENRGRGTGMWLSAFYLAQFITPLLMIALANLFGGNNQALLFMGLLGGALAVSMGAWIARPRSAVPA